MRNLKRLKIKRYLIIGALSIIPPAILYFALIQELTESRELLQMQTTTILPVDSKNVSLKNSSNTQGFCYTFPTKDIATDKDKIKKIHEVLEREGFEISDEEKINLTLEESSRSAISQFQEKYEEEILWPLNLQESTGILGKLTIKKMNELYSCEKKVPAKKYSESRILVKFKEGTSQETINEVIARQKTSISPEDKRDVRERARFMMIKTPEGKSAEETVEVFKKEPDVEYAELDYKGQVSSPIIVNDPYALMQLSFYRIGVLSNEATGAFNLTDINNLKRKVKVAVLDTGIDDSHPELQGRVIATKNFSESNTTLPVCSHGQYTAGLIAAMTNNSVGVTSIANNVSLMNVKVFRDDCWGWYSDAASGVYWAVDNGADAIILSHDAAIALAESSSLGSAITSAWQQGVVVVMPAGNDNKSMSYSSPVIFVGATDLKDAKLGFSNYGTGVDVAAPAASVYTTSRTGYGYGSGTCASSAQTAGLAALILATDQCPYKDNNCVRNKIENTADKIVGTGTYWQYGRINVFKALGGTNYQEPVFKSLVIKKSGTGSGIVRTITPPKAAINCGSKCSAKFVLNSDITIKAIADTDSKFIKWSSGPCKNSTSTTCSFTFNPPPENSSQTITAVFELVKPLVIQKSGTGSGTVKSIEPSTAINCGTKCSANLAVNTKVTLSATPNATSTFIKWTSDGPCNGLATTTCTFIFNPTGSSQTITTVFNAL